MAIYSTFFQQMKNIMVINYILPLGGSECVKLRGATYFMGVGILLLSAV